MIEPKKTLGLLQGHLKEKRNKGTKLQPYLDSMTQQLSTDTNISQLISQVHELTGIIDRCHLNYENIEILICYFTWQKENSENLSEVLIEALIDPTQAKLNQLIEKAKEIDNSFKARGSVKTFLKESFMTCVEAVGFFLECLFAVIAIPASFLVGLILSWVLFDLDIITQPFKGYISFLESSIESIKKRAKEVDVQFEYLTYNKANEAASSYARFFNSQPENELDLVPNEASLII
ncbi:MAG: hypothetical protein H0U70_11935 [Tatlockia sp.]|nr:hypothetical protein [Tatlockia sp.]